jgi:hypothetical protein
LATIWDIYFGMAFISTLFHLPKAFDGKPRSHVAPQPEQLVTQVFDFNDWWTA